MAWRTGVALLLAAAIVLFPKAAAHAADAACAVPVVDVAFGTPGVDGEQPIDVYIDALAESGAQAGTVFEVFRWIDVGDDPARRYRLRLYVGRLHVIDVHDNVLVGRMIELAPRDSHPRVRYETIMIGDCLDIEPPVEQMAAAPAAMGAKQPPAEEMWREVPAKILFRFDISEIDDEWKPVLDELAEYIKAQRPAKVIVEGHADWMGTDEYNIGLSTRRARSVVDYFAGVHGLDRDLFIIEPYGESRPATSNETVEGRRLNRRAVASLLFKIVPTAPPQ
jgi:outer membrane protein OmpA-like peptidoglycan-associated protein